MGDGVTLAILQDVSQPPKTSQGGALCYSYTGHLAKYKLVTKELRPGRVGHCVSYTGHHAKYKSVTKDQAGWGTVLHWPSYKIQVSHQRPVRVGHCVTLAITQNTSQPPKSSDQSGWGFKQPPSMKTVQPIRSQPPAWQWRWK